MKQASAALINYLRNNNRMFLADLWKIKLNIGTEYYWTNGAAPLTIGAITYLANGPIIDRGTTRIITGIEVDQLDFSLKGNYSFSGVPMPQAASNGFFDSATVTLSRCVMPTYGDTSLGAVVLFSGRITKVTPSHSMIRFNVKSDIERLNIRMPRNLYQPTCTHSLYDAGCGVLKTAFTKTATVTGGSLTSINTTLTDPVGWFDQGYITFTTGTLTGVRRTVKSYGGGIITINLPLPAAPNGTLEAVPGCAKTLDVCKTKYNNLNRFRGFPWIPRPENAR